MLVDTHCHLQSEAFDDDRADVTARALDVVDWLVVIADDLANARKGLALADAHDRIYAAVGVHPYHVGGLDDGALAELRTLCGHPKAVALGEIGLDYYHYCDTPRDVQHRAFRLQLDLACETGLPVIIHDREAHDDCLAILGEYAGRLPGCVMHCFSGDGAFAEACLALGFYISFAGNATYPKAEMLRDAARLVPMDRLLVETDSPYLAPKPVRGKRCEPAYVVHTARVLAEVKGIDEAAFAAQTTENAARFFRVTR